jgi:hypothetical protein
MFEYKKLKKTAMFENCHVLKLRLWHFAGNSSLINFHYFLGV